LSRGSTYVNLTKLRDRIVCVERTGGARNTHKIWDNLKKKKKRNYLVDLGEDERKLKIYFKEIEYVGDDWIYLAQDTVQWWVIMYAVMNRLEVSTD
jgi:hypothetical protein